ncbi:cobalamin biosynthesis protein [Klenkia sp. LSe6-5]|uniref:Cobalamin biosynthesis protein n=1 Tax=Klenkia sesuvii TaxID=3103137 RepID=A0ABU8DUI0_9ACTN
MTGTPAQPGSEAREAVEVVVGVGARPGTPADEVLAAVDAVLPPGARVTALATVDRRAAEPGLQAAAASRGWTLVGLAVDRLAQVPVPTVSARVAAALGTPSVAEAAALVEGGTLVAPRTVHGRVTVAVAAR